MRERILPFIIAITLLVRANYMPVVKAPTVSSDTNRWFHTRPSEPHDCPVCDESGCTWGPCPWEQQ